MKLQLFFVLMSIQSLSFAINLPEGITYDSTACPYNEGLYNYIFYKNNEVIGTIGPKTCFFDNAPDGVADKSFDAEFYFANSKIEQINKLEAMKWIELEFKNYYQPVKVNSWQKVEISNPRISLSIPDNWSYRLDTYPDIFDTKTSEPNKLVLMIVDNRGHSEAVMIIRTPNTAKYTVDRVMEINAKLNWGIDLVNNKIVDVKIGGKPFKHSQNEFMVQMKQWHFWYADENEIIYINYNLLKDEKIKYPEVMKYIINSIEWQ